VLRLWARIVAGQQVTVTGQAAGNEDCHPFGRFRASQDLLHEVPAHIHRMNRRVIREKSWPQLQIKVR